MMKRIVFPSLALILAMAVPAAAHEKGAIHLASDQVPIGGELGLRGEKLPKSADIKLVLRGTLDNYAIGEVRTDTAGKFQARLTLPPHVPAGAYSVVAIAPDGDVTARADLVIAATAPTAAGTAEQGMAHMGEQEMPGAHATAEMMEVRRTTTTGEWAVIAAAIVLSFVGGAVLLRRSAVSTAHERP